MKPQQARRGQDQPNNPTLFGDNCMKLGLEEERAEWKAV